MSEGPPDGLDRDLWREGSHGLAGVFVEEVCKHLRTHNCLEGGELGVRLGGERRMHRQGGAPEILVKGPHRRGSLCGEVVWWCAGPGQGPQPPGEVVAGGTGGVGHGSSSDPIREPAEGWVGPGGRRRSPAGGSRTGVLDQPDELLDLALACAERHSGAEPAAGSAPRRALDCAENRRYGDTLVEPPHEEAAVGCGQERGPAADRHQECPDFLGEDVVLVNIRCGGHPALLGHVAPFSGPFYHPGPSLVGVAMALSSTSLVGLLVVAHLGLANAQDDDFDLDLDEESEDDRTAAPEKDPDGGDLDADPDDDEWLPPEETEGSEEIEFDEDFDDPGEDGVVKPRGPGEDTAEIYREALSDYSRLAPDEEALAWERYLRKYPNSIFKSQVQNRVDELSSELYEDAMFGGGSGRVVDAAKRQLHFAQPMLLESIDPRTKLRAGFEWGYLDWVNLMVDYEYAVSREFSAHVGVRQRFTGYTLEAGPRYALVKSSRLGLLVTAIGDVRANFNPGFGAFRPQLGVGKRFNFGDMHLDANLQGGSDLVFFNGLSPRLVFGGNVSLAATDNLRIYIESSNYMKGTGDDDLGSFRFNQMTFGMKFLEKKSKTKDKYEAGFGATAPYSVNYWRYHYGAVAGDVNVYLE